VISLRGLHPLVRERAELAMAWAQRYGLQVTVTSGYRSWAEQTQLRTQYETCLARGERVDPANPNPACRYPANEPGDSAHNYGMAWDSWVPEDQWWLWTYLRRAAGFAVFENDRVHAEVPEWRKYATQTRRG
jgi:D-alanyl-D-alanine carboxypeptidase